jgi:hypothetical protein
MNLVTNIRYHMAPGTGDTAVMADRAGLRIIGFVAASITGAVMLIAVLLVHKTVAGESTFDDPGITASIR